MPISLSFLDLVFTYTWLDNKLIGMFQCQVAFLNEIIPFSIASMASSNASLIHLPLVITRFHLIFFFYFRGNFCPKDRRTFILSWLGLAPPVIHFTSYKVHWSSWCRFPWSQPPTHWGCVIWPYKRYKLEFCVFCPTLKEVWQVKLCLKCIYL
jgi:hypothetical protein